MSELRERILAARDIASERITVEEWGGVEVEVRGMSARARAALLQDSLQGKPVDLAVAYPYLVVECCFDPATGARLFSHDDRDALGDKSGEVLERIALVAIRLSGIDADAPVRSKSDAQEQP